MNVITKNLIHVEKYSNADAIEELPIVDLDSEEVDEEVVVPKKFGGLKGDDLKKYTEKVKNKLRKELTNKQKNNKADNIETKSKSKKISKEEKIAIIVGGVLLTGLVIVLAVKLGKK